MSLSLRLLHKLHQPLVNYYHDKVQDLLNLLFSLKPHAFGGKAEYNPTTNTYQVAVVWSGIDCDGISYANDIHIIDADIHALNAHVDFVRANTDGPCYFYTTSPSLALSLTYRARDLGPQAHENGHPHVFRA